MAGEWKTEKLSDLCEQIVDCPHSTPLWTDSGVIVLRNQNIRGGRLDLSSPSYTDELHYQQRSRRAQLRAGDLVITREAPMGEVCVIPENLRCCLGQRMVMLRPDPKKCDSRFLLYALQSDKVQHEIKVNEGTGSTVSNLRIPLLEALPISYPPLCEQKAIARILGALDDKIELNRRMNATLEAMARALFQSWFVDFDPVHVLAGTKPEQPPLLSAEALAKAGFPNTFQDSELGSLPKGWRYLQAQDVATIGIGKTPPRKEPEWFSENTDDVPWVSIRDMGNSGVYVQQTSEYITSDAVSKFNVRQIQADTVLLSFKLTIGRVALSGMPLTTNEAIAHFNLFSEIGLSREFLYLYLDQFNFESLGSTSSIATAVNSATIRSMPILVPPKELINAFSKMVSPLFEKIKVNQLESLSLSGVRDAMLPRLLSGEINVLKTV